MTTFSQIVNLTGVTLLLLARGELNDVAKVSRGETNRTSTSSPGDLTDGASDARSSLRDWTDATSYSTPTDLAGETPHSSSGVTPNLKLSLGDQPHDVTMLSTSNSTISNSQSSVDQLNTWRSLLFASGQEWRKNYPSHRRHYHISSYKRNIEDKASKLLLVGGIDENGGALNDTWSYAPWSNSWLEIATSSQLPPTHAWDYQVLPTLCDTFVLLINSDNDIWLFDGRNEGWSQIPVHDWSRNYFPVEGTVALRHSICFSTNCSCSESVFAYGRLPNYPGYLQLCELNCQRDQDDQLRCHLAKTHPHECDKIALKSSDQSSCFGEGETGRHGLMAAADHDRGIIYFLRRCIDTDHSGLGKNATLFKYDVQHRTARPFLLSFKYKFCFFNIFVWNNSHVMLFAQSGAEAVSLRNNSEHELYDTGTERNADSFDGVDVVLIMQSLGPVRFHWFPRLHQPYIYVYRTVPKPGRSYKQFVETGMTFPPPASPGSLSHHTSVYDYDSQTFYVYGGVQYDHTRRLMNSSAGVLWTLSVPSNRWWLIEPLLAPGAHICSCGTYSSLSVVLFGGQYDDGRVGNELWIYKTNRRLWERIVSASYTWPESRAGCSLSVTSNGTTSVLFGGYSTAGRAKSDVWLLHLSTNGTAVWQSFTPSPDAGTNRSPFRRFGHSTAIVGHELIIYGGNSDSEGKGYSCLSDMWALSISNRVWRELLPLRRQVLLKTCGFTSLGAAGFGNSFLLPYGQSKVVVWESTSGGESAGVSNPVWMIDTISKRRTDIASPSIPVVVQAAGIWNGSLVYYGRNTTGEGTQEEVLIAIGQRCLPGSAQLHGLTGPCVPCPIGQHSISHLTVSECVKCPPGTTTNRSGVTSVRNCTCDMNYCAHGTCEIPGAENAEIIAVCRCSFGFVGDQCDQIDYVVFVMSFGILAVVVTVTTALACCGIRIVRHRRARRRTEWELEETRRAFTIMPPEIELVGRLDEDCPGGYGEVHKAIYRDWTVAVKQLQVVMAEWVDIRREFLREIQFMRTVRHPNIVMFIAAGQYGENQPFLVLEFMSGGALRSLLQNTDVELTFKDQLQFMLDAAEGMDYLHTLQPPRIHRDLKSANLLLSNMRQVKVADFGCARLIPKLNQATTERQPTEMQNNRRTDGSEQLLNARTHLTSRHVGTPRWRSPEVWEKKSYGTATDVYSFAIVAWEILTRQTPFYGPAYRFDAQVEDAVLNGTRPTIPEGTPQELRHLMTQGWQENPEDRQTFTDIVSQLQTMHSRQQQPEVTVDVDPSQDLPTEARIQLNEPSCPDGSANGSVQAEQHELVSLHQSCTRSCRS